jgi:hypothetical protein
MVVTCRHDIPLRVYNIRGTGERLSYAQILVKNIMDSPDCPTKVVYQIFTSLRLTVQILLYDIGCHFETYLKSRMSDEEFDRLAFAVSIFHMYGHEFKCQVRYSPRRLNGLGLTDGESCERVWAALRYQT